MPALITSILKQFGLARDTNLQEGLTFAYLGVEALSRATESPALWQTVYLPQTNQCGIGRVRATPEQGCGDHGNADSPTTKELAQALTAIRLPAPSHDRPPPVQSHHRR